MASVASDVCKDLVLYDNKDNRFREIIPLTHEYPVLLHIIVANSAIRMSHTNLKLVDSHVATPLDKSSTALRHSSSVAHPRARSHALGAKQRALYLLQTILTGDVPMDPDVTLAVVLLFVEFELLDSGRDNWTYHINGARNIIEKLCGSGELQKTPMGPLRRFLISNCLVYIVSFRGCCTRR